MVAVKAHEADRALASLDRAIRLVLLYGPDQGLIAERGAALAAQGVTDASDPFQLVRIDGAELSSDPARLTDEANTIGLFGGQRAIRVTGAARLPLAAIEPLLSTPPLDSIVIIEGGDMQRTNPVRLAVERARHGLAVPCYADEARGLDSVIDSVLRDFGNQIDRDARTVLAGRLGADRALSRREVEKLALYAGPGQRIEMEHVDAIVGDAAAREIDDIVDGVFSGTLGKVDLAFTRLVSSGEDPVVLLGFVSRHAQALLLARDAIDSGGESIADAVKAMRGVTFPRRRLIETALSRWSAPALNRCVLTLHQAMVQARRNGPLAPELAARVIWNLALSSGKP
jgi:DNA polymerase-3 subunit delta